MIIDTRQYLKRETPFCQWIGEFKIDDIEIKVLVKINIGYKRQRGELVCVNKTAIEVL